MRDHVKPTAARRGYHHGDLPAVLTETAIELITERGLGAFSLAETARRAGVSVAAPYRHFSDKETLLAAVAVRGYRRLKPFLDRAIDRETDPVGQLVAGAGAYVRFSVAETALFTVVARAGLSKSRFPELHEAAIDAYASWLDAARAVTGTEEAATELALDVLTIAHGHAALLSDHQFGPPDEHVAAIERRTKRVVETYLRTAEHQE